MVYSVLGVLLYNPRKSKYVWYYPHIDKATEVEGEVDRTNLTKSALDAYLSLSGTHSRQISVRYGLVKAREYALFKGWPIECVLDYVVFNWRK